MSRKWTLLTLILSLCSSGALQANPLDSPGIVYIDGLPCNRAVSVLYGLVLGHRLLDTARQGEMNVVVPAEAEIERAEHTARPRVARQPLPVSRPVPRAGMAASNATPSNARASHTKKAAAPKLAHQATRKAIPAATATVTPEKTVEQAGRRRSGAGAQTGKLRQGRSRLREPPSPRRRASGGLQVRRRQVRGRHLRGRRPSSQAPRSPARRPLQPREPRRCRATGGGACSRFGAPDDYSSRL